MKMNFWFKGWGWGCSTEAPKPPPSLIIHLRRLTTVFFSKFYITFKTYPSHVIGKGVCRTLDWLQSFLFYIYFSLSLHYFFLSWSSLIQLQVTYGWTKTFLSSQGTEVNKHSTSYTSVVPPQKKRRKRKKRKIKKGSGARLAEHMQNKKWSGTEKEEEKK